MLQTNQDALQIKIHGISRDSSQIPVKPWPPLRVVIAGRPWIKLGISYSDLRQNLFFAAKGRTILYIFFGGEGRGVGQLPKKIPAQDK